MRSFLSCSTLFNCPWRNQRSWVYCDCCTPLGAEVEVLVCVEAAVAEVLKCTDA